MTNIVVEKITLVLRTYKSIFLNVWIVQFHVGQFTHIQACMRRPSSQTDARVHQYTNTQIQHSYTTNTKWEQGDVYVGAAKSQLSCYMRLGCFCHL
jgi:hypothetical protein